MSNVNRYETSLHIAAYAAITEQLIDNNLITKSEEKAIKKRISRMKDTLIAPEKEERPSHDRALSTIE